MNALTLSGWMTAGLTMLAMGFGGFAPIQPPAESPAAPASGEQKVVVHLSQFTNDLHAVSMALKVANAM